MNPEYFEILLDRQTIAVRVAALGVEITRDMQGSDLCIIPVMDGGMIFAADLMRVHLQLSHAQRPRIAGRGVPQLFKVAG